MKVSAQLFGSELGTDNNITRAFRDKEWSILVTLSTDDNRCRHQMILNRDEAELLINELQSSLELGQEYQFKVV